MRKFFSESFPACVLCALVAVFLFSASMNPTPVLAAGKGGGGSDKCLSSVQSAKRQCSQAGMQDSQQANDQQMSDFQKNCINNNPDDMSSQPTDGSQTCNAQASQFGEAQMKKFSKQCDDAITQCNKACKGNPAGLQGCKDAQDNNDKVKQQAKSDGKGGQMPQMPQMPQDNSPSNTPSPLATLDPPKTDNNQCSGALAAMNPCCNPDGTANTTNPSCGGQPQAQQDQTKPSFTEGSSGSGGGGSGGGSSGGMGTQSTNPNQAQNQNDSPQLPGAPIGGANGLGGGQNGKTNADGGQHAVSLDGDKQGEVLQGERSGGGGGGGFSYASGQTAKELEEYLPGRAKDPAKRGLAGGLAYHPDVASKHEDIFAIVSKRYQILCGLKELRDCEAPMSGNHGISAPLHTSPGPANRTVPPKAPSLPMSGPTYIRRSE